MLLRLINDQLNTVFHFARNQLILAKYYRNDEPMQNSEVKNHPPRLQDKDLHNRTVDYGSQFKHNNTPQNNEYHNMSTPQKMTSKRENRLREFYAKSQRKDAGGTHFVEHNPERHKSIEKPFNRVGEKAMDIMNISQQLDQRNVQRHLGRNFDLSNDMSSLHETLTLMKQQNQRSYEQLPKVVIKSTERLPLAPSIHSRGKSNIDMTKKAYGEISKSSFFGGKDNSLNLSSVKINPITGIVSPLQNRKAAVF